MGVLVHGYGTLFYCGNVNKLENTGADFTIECIQSALQHLQTAEDSPWKMQALPSVLKLQIDNCSDNKCAAILGYAALLVETGVFLKIELHFLPVGHTHIRECYNEINDFFVLDVIC